MVDFGEIPKVLVCKSDCGSIANFVTVFFPYKLNAKSLGSGTISSSSVYALPEPKRIVVACVSGSYLLRNRYGAEITLIKFGTCDRSALLFLTF